MILEHVRSDDPNFDQNQGFVMGSVRTMPFAESYARTAICNCHGAFQLQVQSKKYPAGQSEPLQHSGSRAAGAI